MCISIKAAAGSLLLSSIVLIASAENGFNPAPTDPSVWQSAARLHRTLKKPITGTLVIDSGGVEFRAPKFSGRWRWVEIHTFDLSRRDFTLVTYQNQRWHQPGDQRFHFTLAEEIPVSVAALIQEQVAKPARNGNPDPAAPAIAEIPARHGASSNGMLRLRDSGIDYVSVNGRDSRSWRWSDIQTIASPDPYSFRVTAYREIAEFQLKQPLSRELFDRIWTMLYAGDLNVAYGNRGDRL